jgi:hypothetical protein
MNESRVSTEFPVTLGIGNFMIDIAMRMNGRVVESSECGGRVSSHQGTDLDLGSVVGWIAGEDLGFLFLFGLVWYGRLAPEAVNIR